ncbi:DNA replication origin binding protein [Dioszegia hungarica]|uniref:Origin recognition complex subunit 2 n=1 Tax=Dioszegia hungarica TaxID=4972 RepID=A0AA38LVQ6_9TREE|nr:DNA replication origin binding protein [Dioszegia hungarica]KAI9635849.1 DNA replication origin binding protein [Dioszegia hungarica]
MPPRATKRARIEESPEEPEENEQSASHLVSFLTGYDNRGDDREGSSDGEQHNEAGSDAAEDQYDEDVDDEDDRDEEEGGTPIKKSKHGLVGTANERGSSRGTASPRSTPRKRATTRKKVAATPLIQEGEPGFVRPSKADAYFSAHARSARTSGNSYSALVKPLTQAEYELYAGAARSKRERSQAVVDGLLDDLVKRFEQWEVELEEGFNLLMYGFGSKRRLLNRFVTERLCRKGHCVVVNGHFPGLGIRDVLSQIEDTLAVPQDIPVPATAATPLERSAHRLYAYLIPPAAIPSAKRKTTQVSDKDLYLVIHNIDAPSLRTPRSLAILSLLASSPRIHLITSFDHLHTPLLFSSSIAKSPPHLYAPGSWTGAPPSSRGFNWLYHNLTTYDDYDLELSYQRLSASSTLSGLSSGTSGGISEEGALQILRSVPTMGLRLLTLLLSKQLASLPPNPSSHTAYPANPVAPVFGIENDILAKLAKEKFIAREDERYAALMGEFKDHGLVVEALLDAEGRQGRWVWIPLGKAALERVIQEMGGVDSGS